MFKKIILVVLFIATLNAQDNKIYLNENKMDYSDLRVFVGLDGGYAYQINKELSDKSYSYSIYAGIPFSGWDIILKQKKTKANDFDMLSNCIIANLGISGSGTDMTYIGVLFGKSKINLDKDIVRNFNITNNQQTKNFYGTHIGQKYKFSRNFYVKIELEYKQYNYDFNIDKVSMGESVEFIYGIEYKF